MNPGSAAEHPLTFPERRCTSITREERSFVLPLRLATYHTRHPNVTRVRLAMHSRAGFPEIVLGKRESSLSSGKEGKEGKALRKPSRNAGGANEGAVMEDVCESGGEVVRADG